MIFFIATLENCQWADWPTEWEKCTSLCRGGAQTMTRNSKNKTKFKGIPCSPRLCSNNDSNNENCGTRKRSCNQDTACAGPGNVCTGF